MSLLVEATKYYDNLAKNKGKCISEIFQLIVD